MVGICILRTFELCAFHDVWVYILTHYFRPLCLRCVKKDERGSVMQCFFYKIKFRFVIGRVLVLFNLCVLGHSDTF